MSGPVLKHSRELIPDFGIGDPAIARSYLGSHFVNHEIFASGHGKLKFRHRLCPLGQISLNLLEYGPEVEIVAPSLPDFYLFQVTLSGLVEISSAEFRVQLTPGSVFIMNPGLAYRKRWGVKSRQLILKIPTLALIEHMRGTDSAADCEKISFVPRPADQAKIRGLMRYLDFVCADLSDPRGMYLHPGIARSFGSTILSSILDSFDHGADRRTFKILPAYVKRAEAFMKKHLSEKIELRAVASAQDVSLRTLQHAFRRFRNCAPSETLQNLRLDMAHELICKNGSSVTQAALDAGFRHIGRFSQSYRRRFGVRPSVMLTTLHQTRERAKNS